jgi:two pore calcium channel protein 1/two pore calcium channel protein 3
MIPALQQSLYYLAFFVPFLLLFVFVFQPIPLAVVYEDFRKHRRAIAMEDLTKQRIALHAAFVTLDHNG